MKRFSTYKLVATSLMAAFVMVSTFIGITIPIAGGSNTMIHLGNITCLLSGMLLGPLYGGLAAAIGSATFDILNPLYISSAPFTFIFKFIMVFICGKIAYSNGKNADDPIYNMLGASVGSIIYILLRFIKSLVIKVYFLGMETETALILSLNDVMISVIKTVFVIIAIVILVPLLKEKLRIKKL